MRSDVDLSHIFPLEPYIRRLEERFPNVFGWGVALLLALVTVEFL